MNTHLKQLWAAMKLPKNFKKSYKFFCLGLDIRVAQVVEPDMGQVVLLQQLVEGVAYIVGGVGGPVLPGEHVLVVYVVLAEVVAVVLLRL